MKNIIYLLIIAFSTIINAQTEPLETEYSTNFLASDTYFKDVNGELDKFIGTWKYEDTTTNTVFEITFYKEESIEGIRNCTFDRLNANFKLIINGVEQYNTYTNNYGKTFMGGGFYVDHIFQPDGNATEIPVSVNRYHMAIVEPNFVEHLDSSDLTIEYENNSGIEKLNWDNTIGNVYVYGTNQQVNIYQMPLEMELIKQ